MAVRSSKHTFRSSGADRGLQVIAIVYLALILHATCVAEVGTALETLESESSREEERSVCKSFNVSKQDGQVDSHASSGSSHSTFFQSYFCRHQELLRGSSADSTWLTQNIVGSLEYPTSRSTYASHGALQPLQYSLLHAPTRMPDWTSSAQSVITR